LRTSSFNTRLSLVASSLLLAAFLGQPASAQDKKTLQFTDLMKVRQIEQPSISADGRWVAFTAEPDRGDGEVIVRSTSEDAPRYTVALGSHPVFSTDAAYVGVRVNPTLEDRETDKPDDRPHNGMALIETATGTVHSFEDVQSFAFSEDGAWLAYHRYAPAEDDDELGDEPADEGEPKADRKPGTVLVLRDLGSGAVVEIAHVRAYRFDDLGRYLAYSIAAPDNAGDGLYLRDLTSGSESPVHTAAFGHYTSLTWADESHHLAFVAAVEGEDGKPGNGTVTAWDGAATNELVGESDAPGGWIIPAGSELTWSKDAERLFFGWRPLRSDEATSGDGEDTDHDSEGGEDPFDPYDIEAILDDRGVDVWHWLDARIMPQQKVEWDEEKDRTYTAVHHLAGGSTVLLADPAVPDLRVPGNGSVGLATSDVPYRRQATWAGGRSDALVIDLATGDRTVVAEGLDERPSLSPDGRFVAYFDDGHHHLYDVEAGAARNVTKDMGVPIADEDHDYPNPAPGYGIGGWLEDDEAVLIYDKYDIWVVPTDGGAAWSLTGESGRLENRVLRVVDTDPETDAIGHEEAVLISGYHDLDKSFAYYRAQVDRPGVSPLLAEDKRFQFLSRAEDVDVLLYTREAYDEFPDLWVADADFSAPRKVTDVNPEIADFAWGTAELTEWKSLDGRTLQGVVIKPDDYEPGKRYPVLVYYYRFMSDRLHRFNDPSINHRPSFPVYASDGYVVFLPDVRFEVGRPGFSSTKSVVPGVQHLIDIGLADPDAITLHGHSWSGYQTAFMVTQTDIFTTAIAGAPVGNMTSAYSGIRLGSGRARQFQYEQGQSRLSGSLWEARDEYVDNSPVFFADRVNTPMLILHGDVDDAVPWEQSIELFLALRRLDKEAVFLQYRDEPHHPQTYANKLDWAMKMKEWNDHYLKGKPAPKWITNGLPYQGR
jgi:dipeptidyl aminopeptidase/acylaminoacyl peptidase